MRKQMIENAAYEVATQVRAVEDSIDAALAEIAELQARMVRVRSVAGVGFGTEPRRLRAARRSADGLVGARGAIVGCHAALVEAKGPFPACARSPSATTGSAPKTALRRSSHRRLKRGLTGHCHACVRSRLMMLR